MNLKFFSTIRQHVAGILPPVEVLLVSAIILFLAAATYVLAGDPAFLQSSSVVITNLTTPTLFLFVAIGGAFLVIGRRSILFGIAAIFAWTMAAHAQDAGGVATAGSSGTVDQILSYIFDVGVGLLSVAGAWIIKQVISILGVTDVAQRQKVEDTTRNMLHWTVENGLKWAFAKAGLPPSLNPTVDVLADALFYVQNHSPDAIDALQVDEDALKRLIVSKLPDVTRWFGVATGTVSAPATTATAPTPAATAPA